MNMNTGLINRALLATGQTPLTDEDAREKNSAYGLCRAFYISTFLEALSELEWVGGRKRAELVRTGRPVIKDRRYKYVYDLPYDCAKPIELQDNEFFIVEDRLLYREVKEPAPMETLTPLPETAELLYVSNGKVLRPAAVISCGKPGDAHDVEYLTAGPPGTEPDEIVYNGIPQDITDGPDELPDDPVPESDYPDYAALDYEHKFYEYVEKRLAAKFAMKLSDQPQLHAQLLQEALLVKQEAVDSSRSARSAKLKENKWWGDRLGLGEI
jgi:hypothetical protein